MDARTAYVIKDPSLDVVTVTVGDNCKNEVSRRQVICQTSPRDSATGRLQGAQTRLASNDSWSGRVTDTPEGHRPPRPGQPEEEGAGSLKEDKPEDKVPLWNGPSQEAVQS